MLIDIPAHIGYNEKKEEMTMEENICRFLPKSNGLTEINILNFVFETEPQRREEKKCDSVYKMHLVAGGTGRLFMNGQAFSLQTGDLFFTFPALSYTLESDENFTELYISYLGFRANRLMETAGIHKQNLLFHGYEKLAELWKDSITDESSVLHLRCEGLLLYTFSLLGERSAQKEEGELQVILRIKQYMDDHFADPKLSLDTLSREFAYHKKYLSTLFKRSFKVGISGYLTALRIQHACTLMEQGFTSVKDISFLCGYTDPLYFSKVFKEKMGVSPKKHIAALRERTPEG